MFTYISILIRICVNIVFFKWFNPKKIEEKKWKTDKNKRNILSLDTFQRATTNSVDMFMAGVGVGFFGWYHEYLHSFAHSYA